jgi:hypothetical protein
VLAAMLRQPTDLADPRVPALVGGLRVGMKALLRTDGAEVFFYAANGHGGWEAVIANLVAAGTAILVPGTGHFSDGWAEQVARSAAGRSARPYVEGLPIDPAPSKPPCAEDAGIASPRCSSSTPTPRAGRPRTSPRCAAPSTPPAIPRSSSSTSSPRSARRRSRWTRSASTSRSARRRRA